MSCDSDSHPDSCRPRRDFLKLSAVAGLAGALGAVSRTSAATASPAPGAASYGAKSSRPFAAPYSGAHLNRVAFPLGGLGAGMVCLEGTGALSHVSIRHKPDVFHEPCLFAAVSVRGATPVARVLEGRVPAWKLFGSPGSARGGTSNANGAPGSTYGLPRFARAEFAARFPFATVTLEDRRVPLRVELTGWSPFTPPEADSSSLPVAALEYRFTNPTDRTLEAVFSYNASNFLAGRDPAGAVQSAPGGFVLRHAGSPGKPGTAGSFAVAVDDPVVQVNHAWFRGAWMDALTMSWNDVAAGACYTRPPVTDGAPPVGASLFVPFQLAPGASKTIALRLCWHVPDVDIRTGGELTPGDLEKLPIGERAYQPWYPARFPGIDEVAAHWRENYGPLRAASARFPVPVDSMKKPVNILGASSEAFEKTSANLPEPHAVHIPSRSSYQSEASFTVSDPIRMKKPMKPLACALALFVAFAATTCAAPSTAPEGWVHLSSRTGDLAAHPGDSKQQTAAIVADFDGDGVNDFINSFREKPPAVLFYRRTARGWDQYVVEPAFLTTEAGGAVYDIDGDGDLDVVIGGDYKSDEVWWWENPAPNFDNDVPWKRHTIKKGGGRQHHDQCFGDFLGVGRPQLAFWNQKVKTLFLAEFPDNPREADEWPQTTITSSFTPNGVPYVEGMSAFDVDADGKPDLLACDSWFKHVGGREFKQVKFASHGGLIFAGYFKPSKYPQIVVSPGDATGPLKIYECTGDPLNPADWQGRELLDRPIVHGHCLQLGDIDADGHLDIFVAEKAKWTEKNPEPNNPGATAWILYGDGQGNFRTTVFASGLGWHEARLADLDGDGDLDLLNKPYNWDAPRVDVWLNGGTRAGARGVGTSKIFPGSVGLELWSLRQTLKTNVPLGLQTARGLGFTEVEVAGLPPGIPPAQLRSMLLAQGLYPVSSVCSYEDAAGDLGKLVADATALGVKYIGVGWLPRPGGRNFTEADAIAAAEVFNRAGAELAKAGIRFYYHNHGYEFVPAGEGRTLFDVIAEKTDPNLVCFEIDIFWAVHGGQDPVKLMQRHPGRWRLMHVKDMRYGTETGGFTGKTDKKNDVTVGTGIIDIPAALREGVRQGIEHYFIEDESPHPLKQIPESLRYLENLSW